MDGLDDFEKNDWGVEECDVMSSVCQMEKNVGVCFVVADD